MMATPSRDAFADPDWLYELKLDGFRLVAVIREGKVRLLSRRGNDAGRQFPELQELSRLVQPAGAIIDGEIVALGEDGSPSFSLLQQRTGWKGGTTGEEPHASVPVRFYAFDILHYEGLSLLRVPLRERRRLLQASLLPGPHVSILDSFSGADGPVLYKVVKQQGQEGVLAKRLDSIYEPGRRSRAWLKIKAVKEQDCVVVGFTAPNPGRQHFGSLALAVFEGGKLAYAGLVGSGFDGRTLAAVKKELDQRVVARTPLEARKDLAPRGITWVRPDLLCQVKYTEWTRDHILRQPTFLHMRADKLPTDCERAVPA